MTYLEDLPNEILLSVYRYLYSLEILYAFTDLNKRIEGTLFKYKQHIDLRYSSAQQFSFLIEKRPELKDSISTLVVDDEWTNRTTLVYAILLPKLQKLTLVSFNNINLAILLENFHLPMLKSLYVGRKAISLPLHDENRPSTFFHQTRNLKQLKWNESFIDFPHGAYIVENLIEHLTISVCGVSTVILLFVGLPCLRYCRVSILSDDGPQERVDVHLPNLREFHLSIFDSEISFMSWSSIAVLMQYLPSTLERFSFEGIASFDSEWLDGNAWIQLIPNGIQSFQLLLEVYFNDFCSPRLSPEEMKQSWSTSFWIDDKHCYMQCFNVQSNATHLLLCTDDCSDFSSFVDSMQEAKLVFTSKPNDFADSNSKPVVNPHLHGLNKDAYTWIDNQKQTLSTVERLFFENGRIFLSNDITPYYLDIFRSLRSLTLYSRFDDGDLIQYLSSFSRLTSLTISDLDTAGLILNCDRIFNRIKIFRIEITDFDINQIDLKQLLHIFPHLYGLHVGFILYTQLEGLVNEKLIEVMPTALKISFRPHFGKLEREKDTNTPEDETKEQDKETSEQKLIRNTLAHDVVSWFKDHTFLDNLSHEFCSLAAFYPDEHDFSSNHGCLTIWQ